MGKRLYLPRLSQNDVEELLAVRANLDAMFDAVDRSSMARKADFIAAVVKSAGVLDRLLQRAGRYIESHEGRKSPETPSDASNQGAALDSTAEGEKAAPDEPGEK